ncbi:guanylate kinase [Endomicrobiia bacterium]|nr:guanylate kinase [Endomicrobiia bacterium]GHT64009.1 guanylate kinase [Endomicrobiia bacterium]GHT73675.1 guanylate kinase [Endomicrobiia bacterium]
MNKKSNNHIEPLGSIIVISAPSGAGKTSVCSAVVKSGRSIVYSISYTTRCPRQGEKNGREYFFVDESEFKKMIEEKKFAEWAKVHGNYYGTSKGLLDNVLKTRRNILLEIDVQGGINIKKQYPQACMIFIMTPDIKTLEKRLTARDKDCKKIINVRLNNAKKELKYLNKYEYLVINKQLNETIDTVKTIIKSLEYKIEKNQKYF